MSTTNEVGIILPPEILSQQVCSACHKHLSVGPVLVTRKGRIICGRCKVGSEERPTYSMYNRIAAECLFPCTNQGCRELLPFAQVKDHEESCRKNNINYGTYLDEEAAAGPYLCQENYFLLAKDSLASGIQSDSNHCKIDYVGKEGGDLEIAKDELSYVEKFKNLIRSLWFPGLPTEINGFEKVNCFLKMDAAALRQFMRSEFVKMQKCVVCKKSVRTKSDAFFCPSEHLACRNCNSGKCTKCNSFVVWSSLSRWHSISLKCEWDCDLDLDVFEYMRHVQQCGARQYKCPDRNCMYVGRLDDFKRHWHLDQLLCEREYKRYKVCSMDRAVYWLLPDLNELVYIAIERRAFRYLYITLYNYDVVLPTSFNLYADTFSYEVLLKNVSGRFLRRTTGFLSDSVFLSFNEVDM